MRYSILSVIEAVVIYSSRHNNILFLGRIQSLIDGPVFCCIVRFTKQLILLLEINLNVLPWAYNLLIIIQWLD